jgi:hypothetical protein
MENNTQTTSIEPAEFTERFINQTGQSIFLTGKAGTGKTTLLRKIMDTTYKKAVIVAPTGIAALNAGGVTIHSFFQLPFGGFIPDFKSPSQFPSGIRIESKDTLTRYSRMSKERVNLIRSMELLIVDEVSMLRADVLDAIDWVLRKTRNQNEPFGGVQVLFIGDLFQLPPVVKQDEWSILREYYHGMHFFNAHALINRPPLYIELSKIYRQDDQEFIDVLNNLRNNQITPEDLQVLNQYVRPEFKSSEHTGFITLTTHNAKADKMNQTALVALEEKSNFYNAEVTGDFPQHMHPVDVKLELKIGAQVMFIKNDLSHEKRFFNGKMGIVKTLSPKEITIHFPDDGRSIEVEKYEWENVKYGVDEATGGITEDVQGTFVHYPIKLAWAITVHKSQGLTFDKAVIDVSSVFAPGQAYVALSRLRSLQGLVMLQPMKIIGLSNDRDVVQYATQKADETTLVQSLEVETRNYLLKTLQEAFDWHVLISKWNIFEASYKKVGPKTEKAKHAPWVSRQAQAIQLTSDSAKKFQNQLRTIFFQEKFDLQHVADRLAAAHGYFFKTLDGVAFSTLKKIAEMNRIKKTKQFVEELEELDQLQTDAILNLKRARILIENIVAGKEITKETIWSPEIMSYKKGLANRVKQEFQQPTSLLDDTPDQVAKEMDRILESSTDKKEKGPKKSTLEKTLELFQEGMKPEKIAQIRQMSLTTIHGHFVRLIQEGELELKELLDPSRIIELGTYFEGYDETSLTPLKEKLGDLATWEELKLYRATLA